MDPHVPSLVNYQHIRVIYCHCTNEEHVFCRKSFSYSHQSMVTETKEDAEKADDEFMSQAKSKATTNQRGQVSTTSINDFRNQSSAIKDYTFIYQVRQNKKSIKTRSAPIVGRTERKIEDLGIQQCYKFDVSPGALILRYDGVVLKHPRWTRYNQDREDFAYD